MTFSHKIKALKVDNNRLMSSGDISNPPLTLIPFFWATLHVTNKCCSDSPHSWQKGHNKFVSCKPLLSRLDLVGNLSSSNLYAHTITEGVIGRFHSSLKTLEGCSWSSFFSILYQN